MALLFVTASIVGIFTVGIFINPTARVIVKDLRTHPFTKSKYKITKNGNEQLDVEVKRNGNTFYEKFT